MAQKKVRKSVFGDNENEEKGIDLSNRNEMNKLIFEQNQRNLDRLASESSKIFLENPDTYLYDHFYDEIQRKRQAIIEQNSEKGKTRYINNIARAAEQRQKEKLIYTERIQASQRKREGFDDSLGLSFITDSYLQKQEELKKFEREDAKKEEYNKEHTAKDFNAFHIKLFKNEAFINNRELKPTKKEALYSNPAMKTINVSLPIYDFQSTLYSTTPASPYPANNDESADLEALEESKLSQLNCENPDSLVPTKQQESRSRSRSKEKKFNA